MFFIGIDIGSTATKICAMDEDKRLVGSVVAPLGTGTDGIKLAVEQLKETSGLSVDEAAFSVATGYGRLTYKDADKQISEISCHAKGVHFCLPEVRTLIDIGGQDTKVISMDSTGRINQFAMNDKCAAGTGRFLDVMARLLNLPLNELGDMDAKATERLPISNTCTVFAESEVISKLAAGAPIPNILGGIHQAVARRVAGLVYRVGLTPAVAMSGGVAVNSGVVRALAAELGQNILLPESPQIIGACGAALYAWEEYHKREN